MKCGIIGGILILSLYQCAKADQDYFYAFVGGGINSGVEWVGEDDFGALARFGYTTRVSKKYNIWFDIGGTHGSHYNLGAPANDKDESWFNHVGAGFEMRWYR